VSFNRLMQNGCAPRLPFGYARDKPFDGAQDMLGRVLARRSPIHVIFFAARCAVSLIWGCWRRSHRPVGAKPSAC